jgi:5'-3' exonuclease
MGLKGFYKLVKRTGYVPSPCTDFTDKVMAVDGKAMAYSLGYSVDVGADVATSVSERIGKFMDVLVNDMGAQDVIFVVDGNSVPKEKLPTLLKRSNDRKRLRERTEEMHEIVKKQKEAADIKKDEDIEQKPNDTTEADADQVLVIPEPTFEEVKLDKLKRAERGVTSADMRRIVEMLVTQGRTTFVCREEADFGLSWLSMHGHIDYVVADDADLLVSGCKNLVRGLYRYVMAVHYKNDDVVMAQLYEAKGIREAMKLTADEMLQLACLLNCDYMSGIGKVGPVTALKGIQEHKSVKAFVESWTDKEKQKYKLPCADSDTYCQQVMTTCNLLCAHHPDAETMAATLKCCHGPTVPKDDAHDENQCRNEAPAALTAAM